MRAYQNDFYFYMGALSSFFLFFLVTTLFAWFIIQGSQIKQIQLNSTDYISVNLDVVPTAPPKKVAPKPQEEEKVQEPEPEVLETVPEPKKVNTDLSSLFGEVKTKELVKRNKTKKSRVDEKFLKKIQKRIETKKTKQVATNEASSLVKNMRLAKQDIKVVGDSSGVVDEYLAKIHAEIYSKFYPPAESVGKSAKVRLEIDAAGLLVSFRVISYANDELFNEAVDSCLNALHQFPAHPDRKAISLDIILTAKE